MKTYSTPRAGASAVLALCFSIILILVASYLILLGTGLWTDFSLLPLLSLSIIILLLNCHKLSFYLILIPLALAHIFYLPVGLNFGAPSYQYIASLFSTDMIESAEFLMQIPWHSYVIALSILPLLFIARRLQNQFSFPSYQNKFFLIASALILGFSSPAANFLHKTYGVAMEVKTELERLNSFDRPSEWGESQLVNSQYDDYVLIIGESARRDYLHAYGYPIENTPFMSQSNGVLQEGLTSGGTNTTSSLRLMLTQPDRQKWEPHYELNIVDLMKSAGLKTYWLSNQGFLGQYDTPVTSIAHRSDVIQFLKKGGSLNSTNHSDFELLPKLAQMLQDGTQQKRFIVLHLYGSHPLACGRVEDYPLIFKAEELDKKYHYLNCYISSIKKTDDVLKAVFEHLQQNAKQTGRTFSMVYFADHGMCHKEQNGEMLFNLSCASKLHNNIPLFKVSSDDQQRTQYKAFKSGLHFLEGIANWVGVKNAKINPNQQLFSGIADPSDYGLQKQIDARIPPLDPAIDISPRR